MQLRMYGATDKGLVRQTNQDAFFHSADFGIAIVSDGMGGHKGGEIASRLVVEGLRDAYLNTSEILVDSVGPFLDEVLRKINADILRRAADNENLKGMGATVNYLQFGGGRVAIGHAGDSRTYLIRSFRRTAGKSVWCGIWPLTIDHNVGTFIERGVLLPGRDFPPGTISEKQKARLTRGMGVLADLKADLYGKITQDGDVFLTCSDGLHGYVSDQDILKALMAGPIESAPKRLVDLAHSVGAPDNVTVVISIISSVDEPLRDPANTPIDKPPYLVRMPNGEVRGPLSAQEIITDWVTGYIPGNAEISASLKRWIHFEKHVELFKSYPELDCPQTREHISRMSPFSGLEVSSQPRSVMRKHQQSTPSRLMLLMGILALCTAVFLYQKMGRGPAKQSPAAAPLPPLPAEIQKPEPAQPTTFPSTDSLPSTNAPLQGTPNANPK